ncbi:Non-functional pseudokinase ZED1 [Camellia lanceoleosa]|uniref:Non-functional pseudokinase ZED1 n=1 Tax=Camellia lanceoleosa TaxID=1840588 RepID=A0ACC0FSE9_9ERIC|nr:Non-functional pseudokinase ZED1 [Camellia lanceoleosa]
MFLEDLVAFSNDKYNSSIRRFSIQELSQATNGFCSDQIVLVGDFEIYKGSFDKRLILIKKNRLFRKSSEAIHDMVITSLMSSHKNALKLIGCCLDFHIPASVYEYVAGGSIELLPKRLYKSEGGMAENGESSSSTWKSRLKIANDIAYVVTHMHTTFSTPISHRDLKPSNIIIDQYGVAELLDFSLCISIPLGETQVEDEAYGTVGFIDPVYMSTGFLTEKSNVYSFGVILLELLTEKRSMHLHCDRNQQSLQVWVKDSVKKDQFNEFVDPRILKNRGGIEQGQQLQAVLALALRCTQYNKEDRPEMIDDTKELRRMLKSDCPPSSTQP